MADIYTTLKTRTNQDNVYPNIKVNNIPDGEIVRNKLANNIINESKLADFSVSSGKLQSGAVTQAKLAMGAVDNLKLADGAVTTAKIADEAITTAKIKDGAVTNAKVGDYSLTSIKFNRYERSLSDIWNTYCGGNDFHNFCLAMETIMTSPFVKIYHQDTPSTYTQTVPVYIEVSRDDMITFHIKDYGVNTWTIVTFENGDPFPTTGLENVFVIEIGGVFDYLL